MQCSRKSLFMLDKYFDYFTATVSDRLQVCGSPHQPVCGKNSWLTRPLQSHDLTIHDWLHLHPLVLPLYFLLPIWKLLCPSSGLLYLLHLARCTVSTSCLLSSFTFTSYIWSGILYLLHLIWSVWCPLSHWPCLLYPLHHTHGLLSPLPPQSYLLSTGSRGPEPGDVDSSVGETDRRQRRGVHRLPEGVRSQAHRGVAAGDQRYWTHYLWS